VSVRDGRGILRRLGVVGVCVLSVVGSVALAAWQWNRFESASGSWQNLGYVLQWPLFGLFPAFAFWRLRRLRAAERQAPPPSDAPEPTPTPAHPARAVSPDDHGDDPELAAYNRMLARLNARDQES